MNDHEARETPAAQPEVPKSEAVTRRLRSRPPPAPTADDQATKSSTDEGSSASNEGRPVK
jgi:hypothetical protein